MSSQERGISKTSIIAIVAVIAVVGIVAVAVNNQSSPNSETNNEMMMNGMMPNLGIVIVPLVEQNNSKESGTANLVEEGDRVRVVIELKNTPKGVVHPAHIHVGTCSELGAVNYPLNNLVDGKSETLLNVSIHSFHGSLVALNVHKSVEEPSVYVSCGNVTSAVNDAMTRTMR